MQQQPTIAVILSDLHIGDDEGIMALGPRTGYVKLNGIFVREELDRELKQIDEFVQAQGNKIPRLILNGDLWDVAVRSVAEVDGLSTSFFKAVKLDRFFEEILFLPGNHDHHLWQLLQTQTCILRPLQNRRTQVSGPGGTTVFDFPQAQCGFLDLPSGSFNIPGVKGPYKGDVFLTALTGNALPVNVVYPNLYLRVKSDAGSELTLVTHGHFFELGWSLLSELVAEVLEKKKIPFDFALLEMINSPLTEFINFSLAQQQGQVAQIVDDIYNAVRAGQTPPQLTALREGIVAVVDELLSPSGAHAGGNWFAKEWTGLEAGIAARVVTSLLKGKAGAAVSTAGDGRPTPSLARWDASFLTRDRARTRIASFLGMCLHDTDSVPIRRLIFGHTHVAFPGTRDAFDGTWVEVWNTGGWVPEAGKPCSILAIAVGGDGTLTGF